MLEHIGILLAPGRAAALALVACRVQLQQPLVHPGLVEEPGIVPHMMRQHEMPVGADILGGQGVIAVLAGGALFHGGVEEDDHAQHVRVPAGRHDPGPGPVGGTAFEAFAAVGPALFQRAQEGHGQPLAVPGPELFGGLHGIGVARILPAGQLVGEDVVAVIQAVEEMRVAAAAAFSLELFIEIADVLAQGFQRQGEVQKLGHPPGMMLTGER